MKPFAIAQMVFSALTKPRQHVVVREIPPGRILDIGGGGEGVIARVGGASVVAVDRSLSEVQEAQGNAPDARWLVADAAELPCKSHCFDHATAFFSCMYMADEVKPKVFRETWRVLQPGGEFWIWDAEMVPRGQAFAIRLRVDLSEKPAIDTVYGVRAKAQSAAGLAALLQEAGFAPEVITEQKHWFLIKARRI